MRPSALVIVIATTAGAALGACAPRTPATGDAGERWDVLIAGGTVVDGTGAPGFRADVAVRGDRIVRISRRPLSAARADRVIDATGLVVAPGFIDLHAHIERLLTLSAAESKVRDGVTLALGGPDGGGPWPFGRYLDSAAASPLGINVAFLVGHNSVRRGAMGRANRAPTDAELARMRGMVAEAMGQGAYGFSTGLIYVPGTYATTDEVVALAQAAADSGGIYTSHIRNEGPRLLAAMAEAIDVGRRARMPVVITHHKTVGVRNRGQSVRSLALVDSVRALGQDVVLDQYPYTATSTSISSLWPTWALADGDSAIRRRLADPVLRDSIARGIADYIEERDGGDLAKTQFARVRWMPSLEGRTLRAWAEERGLPPTAASGAVLVMEAVERGDAGVVYHTLDEPDVVRIMRHPVTMIASDGSLNQPGDGHPHPRAYGTFSRVLGRYARDQRVLTLETAVAKMTGMPAARLGLVDRGRVAEGAFADLTVFDPRTVRDRATFEAPHQYPEGIPFVLVNGAVTVDEGNLTAARAGRVLRRGR